jgi:carbon-monoxide dehydrogenase small subunit
MTEITVRINGEAYEIAVADHWTVLDVLRDRLGLTGTKDGCSEGVCGACSVFIGGRLVRACLTLARRVDGAEITTIEGVGGEELSHVQQAFVRAGAIQCGFCTPGMVMASTALLAERTEPTDEQIREFLAGNLCRCTGYVRIFEAVRAAARTAARGAEGER